MATKMAARKKLREELASRQASSVTLQREREVGCFWTWPWGHVRNGMNPCVVCGKSDHGR